MPKRPASESPEPSSKRHRPNVVPYIKRLSDELFLRIASFLSISDLTSCQRVSKRFSRIATDGQIWKALFYRRFVRPRASRIPGVSRAPPSSLHYSSRNSRWLEDEGLARTSATNWKQLYKLRHNWNKGICRVSEVDISANEPLPPLPPPVPPLLVRLHEGMVFTVDSTHGLRAWKWRNLKKSPIANADLYQSSLDPGSYGAPTAMAIDEDCGAAKVVNITVGFEKGGFCVYQLDMEMSSSTFRLRYIDPRNGPPPGNSSHGPMIISMAYCTPYLLTMTASQLLTAYRFEGSDDIEIDGSKGSAEDRERMMHAPKILTSLHSHTVWPPLSLSLRRSAQSSVIACIVYAFPLYISGWSVGIQELRFSDDADGVHDSRIATAVPSGFNPVPNLSPASPPAQSVGSKSHSQANDVPLAQPTCLSYTHPYLLASHADNTLTLYLVKSTASSVSIDSGQRLWGHTSGVSTAQVSSRGKAVSMSTRGLELRVWELEGGVSEKRRLNASVRVESSQTYKDNDVVEEWRGDSQGWLGGFDEEKVVVLRAKDEGRQALVVYDFSR
ncbi:hypothetical protein DFP73DRAFT_555865 [Morchella snyderi]|nr:hypothetical protein DFP73DRAFT_555865 [Morchella snyderi]